MVRCRRLLEVIERDQLFGRVASVGAWFLTELEALASRHPGLVSNVRGRGLMCAFNLPSGAERDELIRRLWERRVIMLASGLNSVRFRPTLTVSRDEIDDAVAAVREALS
jgi:L-lysine 6-transaminase